MSSRNTARVDVGLFEMRVDISTIDTNVGIRPLGRNKKLCAIPEDSTEYAHFVRVPSLIEYNILDEDSEGRLTQLDVLSVDELIIQPCPTLNILRCINCPKRDST